MKPINLKRNDFNNMKYTVKAPNYKNVEFWNKRVLTTNEVSALFECSPAQVVRLTREEGLPCKQFGYVRLFSFDQILDWIEGK